MNTSPKALIYSTQPLRDALAEYDRTAPERARMWDTIDSVEDVDAAEKADKEALHKVQLALHEVSKDRNSLENCLRAEIGFIRRIASEGND